jgi:hypothetical protein
VPLVLEGSTGLVASRGLAALSLVGAGISELVCHFESLVRRGTLVLPLIVSVAGTEL